MKISVVIPAYNDGAKLDQCLAHLAKQEIGEQFEVIVVDDGSTDNTKEVLEKWRAAAQPGEPLPGQPALPFELKIMSQPRRRQAAARNLGASGASGDLLIFIGADILVQENWLATHKKFHESHPEETAIAVGYMTWPPELANDRFRSWLESSGFMLSFKGLINEQKTDFWHFYTGNISMKKSLFVRYRFDENFQHYGWEDIMLGYEMLRDGAILYYLSQARAWHDHALTEADFFPDRLRESGHSALTFSQKHPEAGVIPTGLKLLFFRLLALPPVASFLYFIHREWGWYALSKRYFLEGTHERSE